MKHFKKFNCAQFGLYLYARESIKICGFIIDIMKGYNEKLWLEDHLFMQRALGEENLYILKVT